MKKFVASLAICTVVVGAFASVVQAAPLLSIGGLEIGDTGSVPDSPAPLPDVISTVTDALPGSTSVPGVVDVSTSSGTAGVSLLGGGGTTIGGGTGGVLGQTGSTLGITLLFVTNMHHVMLMALVDSSKARLAEPLARSIETIIATPMATPSTKRMY